VIIVKCADASMTVNTKEAMKIMMGMFYEPAMAEDDYDQFPVKVDGEFERQFTLEAGQSE